ncbi:hypothetical protein ES708_19274 [subsurface metagenome]
MEFALYLVQYAEKTAHLVVLLPGNDLLQEIKKQVLGLGNPVIGYPADSIDSVLNRGRRLVHWSQPEIRSLVKARFSSRS